MEVIKTIEEEKAVIQVKGRLDSTTAPQLEEELNEVTNTCKDITLDFEALQYVSSAGLRVLLKTQKIMQAKGSMKIIHVNAEIMEVFELTGFLDILTIE